MAMTFYADGIKNISIHNGVVHFELVTVSFDEKNEPIQNASGHFALSMNGFINLHEQMNQIVKKMLDEGLLKQTESKDNSEKS